jgi:hypothetical protein
MRQQLTFTTATLSLLLLLLLLPLKERACCAGADTLLCGGAGQALWPSVRTGHNE